jgi:protein-serine/threonine kinase
MGGPASNFPPTCLPDNPSPHAISAPHAQPGQPVNDSALNPAWPPPSLPTPVDPAVPVFHVRSPSAQVPALSTFPLSTAYTPVAPADALESDHSLVRKSTLSTMSFNSQSSLSPASGLSSPALAAMSDITPLPSPLLDDSSGSLKRYQVQRRGSSGSLSSLREHVQESEFASTNQTAPSSRASSIKKKTISTLAPAGGSVARRDGSHSRNRSLSDFVPEATHVVRPRNATLPSQPGAPDLHREEYIAEQRGFVHQTHEQGNSQSAFPTPPSSNRSVTESEGDDSRSDIFREFFVVPDARGGTISYRPVRLLGQGTFSKVVLATSEPFESKRALRETPEADLDAKKLVAIKIVEHGPAGGANAERMQLSLKREIELMQEISHPSLIHLESFDTSGDAALLVLNYCAGGDLFDLACQHRDVLSQAMVQRIFAELVGAVLYLHEKWIVHRDIKLESKLSCHYRTR